MTRNVTDRTTAGQRAGLPLARAQRLAAETQKRAGKGSASLLYGLALLGVSGLVGFGLFTEQSSVPSSVVATQTALPEQPLIASPTAPAMAEVSVPVAEIVSAAVKPLEMEKSAEPQAVSLPINSSHPACVQSVETRLNILHETTVSNAHWSKQQSTLSDLVQSVLDCNETRLKIRGSMELIGTDMADVRVRWDLKNWTLDLNMIDNIEQHPALSTSDTTDGTVEFVIR